MLQLSNLIRITIVKPGRLSRCFVTEPNKSLDDLERERRIKVIELEMSVRKSRKQLSFIFHKTLF